MGGKPARRRPARKPIANATRNVSGAMLGQSFDRRAALLGLGQGAVGLLLATRLGYIALVENAHYRLLSENNRVSLTLIPPRRGAILDRLGQPLAANRGDFRVDIIPERVVGIDQTLAELAGVLGLDPIALQTIRDRLAKAAGFQPVEVATHLDWERFAAISVRAPDLPGVVPQRGFARFYPAGPCVGHLIGYVGAANAADYAKDHDPLLITPGFKVGKDGLEKRFEAQLRGVPGARRAEVTASGRIVRDLETRDDVPGDPLSLTIHAGLQDYAARRLGPESGTVVVIDTLTGDILALVSMPSFDPNAFSDGIDRLAWKMLSDDDHLPLRNKVLHGLYPPGSTVKPSVALAFLEAGLDPAESIVCTGGLRVGNRVFHCWQHHGHGKVDMLKGIYQSCDVYFYHFAQKVGMEPITLMLRRMGLETKYNLPFSGQSYGTVAGPKWKQRHFHKPWEIYDTVNCTIGQGYILVNPLQQAVVASRLGTGLQVTPRLLLDGPRPSFAPLGIKPEHLALVQQGMWEMVNGRGTGHAARLPVAGVEIAGKSGTAQVVGLNIGNGKGGAWKHRDHGHFICFGPTAKPRFACHVLIEHGGGSKAAMPVAKDVMTYLFDPARAWDALAKLEAGWGGPPQARMARKYAAYVAQYGVHAPSLGDGDAAVAAAAGNDQTPPQPEVDQAASPAPEPTDGDASAAAGTTAATTPVAARPAPATAVSTP